ncbi:MAG: mechanosensitive ion channel [Candidatus Eisenbacteria bacterium]|uniref:Mechanosensitive ion channel n=1 Tax=Eiseniibacteriota bacterium TaxID=2212470 RepID=A0A7Y2H3N6_UNCEI|nr:mechanosensitive ion channel [Candidatus Eisenbacteria bacterium]
MDIILETIRADWDSFLKLAPRIVYGILVFFALTVLGRILSAAVLRVLRESNVPPINHLFFSRVIKWVFVLLGVSAALVVMGFEGMGASVLAGGGMTAVVLGFAFKGILENFLAGFSLLMDHTFRVGDLIESSGHQGKVESISLRHTHIRAADGRDIFIPSFQIFSNPLVNYTKDGYRRFAFTMGLDYRDDIGKARDLLEKTVRKSGLVLEAPSVGVIIKELSANFVTLQVHYWIDTHKKQPVASVPTALMNLCREAILEAGYTVSSEVTTAVTLGSPDSLDVTVRQTTES